MGSQRNARFAQARARHGWTQRELADYATRELAAQPGWDGRVIESALIARLERGAIRWPAATVRAALRAVLNVRDDHELGLTPRKRAVAV